MLQVREGSCPYQAPSRRVAYALQEPLCEKLEILKKQQIIVPLDIDETAEWCNSFMLVTKENGKARLCFDLAQLNKVLDRPIHRGPTLNDVLPRFAGVKYIMFIDVSSGYDNLDKQSSYLTTFSLQIGRHRYI